MSWGPPVAFGLVCLSLALLVYSVPNLSTALPHALLLTLFPAVLGSILFALHGRLPVAVGGPGPAATLCVLLLLSTLGADLTGHVSAQELSLTLAAALALASLVTGVIAVFSARLGLAERVRFLPAEVFGGMLAGFGLLLIKAWFFVLTLGTPQLAGLFDLPMHEMGRILLGHVMSWGPPVAFGLVYFVLRTNLKGMLWPLLLSLLTIAGWNFAMLQGGPVVAEHMVGFPVILDKNSREPPAKHRETRGRVGGEAVGSVPRRAEIGFQRRSSQSQGA